MKIKWDLIFSVFSGVIVLCWGDDDPYRHTLVLNREGTAVLDWKVDNAQSIIYFNISAPTRGYVAFGIANSKGEFLGADIVIGGVSLDGSSYFSDRHGIGTGETEIDASQDWTLLSAWQTATHTTLSFYRPFETCDHADDQPINENVVQLIWYYGQEDDIHSPPLSGPSTTPVYLLDPDLTPREITQLDFTNVTHPQPISQFGQFKVWNLPFDRVMSVQDTEYLCTYHKPPTQSKHHMVGFRNILHGEVERRHVHHYLLFLCRAPNGLSADALFGPHVDQPGTLCYHRAGAQNRIPTQYCQLAVYAWAIGGGSIFFPDHVGVPLSESPDDYYLMQVHHDNPEGLQNVRLRYSLEIFYTDELRQYDGGAFFLGTPNPYPGAVSIIIPPNSTDHIIYGHCATGCTQKMFPATGIHFFAGLPHLHFTGKGIRTLNIRNNQESAIIADDNFNPYYQPNRIFRKEHTVLPGDMMVTRCIYDSSNRTGAITAGYSARSEMCNLFAYYYPLLPNYAGCVAELESDAYRSTLQIFDTEWSDEKRDEIVTSPPSAAGLTVTEAASRINWDKDMRTQLQTHQRFLPQVSKCPDISAESITRFLQQVPPSNPVLQRYLRDNTLKNGPATLTNLNDEIQDPQTEFISLWPKDLSFYRPPTRCSA